MRLPALLVAFALLAGCERAEREAVPNVRLGMAPRDVRDRFQPGSEGTWQTALGAGDDTVLEWTAKEPGAATRDARFEFHLGMLVAIRAHLAEKAAKERVSSTPKTVTMWGPDGGGSRVVVLARDCPTHKDEADALAAKVK